MFEILFVKHDLNSNVEEMYMLSRDNVDSERLRALYSILQWRCLFHNISHQPKQNLCRGLSQMADGKLFSIE